MKIVTAKNGSQKAVLSKSNWESIGMKAGWMKEAKWKDNPEIKQTGENTKQTIAQLKKEISKLKKEQEGYKKDHAGKASKKITEKLREKNFAIRAKKKKDKWGKTK